MSVPVHACTVCNEGFASRNKLFEHLELDHRLLQRTLELQTEAENEIDSRVSSAREVLQDIKDKMAEQRALQQLAALRPPLPTAQQEAAPTTPTPTLEANDPAELEEDPRTVDILDLLDTCEIVEEPEEWDTALHILRAEVEDLEAPYDSTVRSPTEAHQAEQPEDRAIFHLSDEQKEQEDDSPPKAKSSVATVTTKWTMIDGTLVDVCTLSDSGCNNTAIRESLARKAMAAQGRRMLPFGQGNRLAGAAGEPFIALGTVKLACIVEGHIVEHWYTVYPDSLPYDVIWGTDFFSEKRVIMNFGTKTITFGGGKINVQINEIKRRRTPTIKLLSVTTTTLQPGEARLFSMVAAQGSAPMGLVGRVTGCGHKPGEGPTTHEAVSISTADLVKVTLTNASMLPITVRKGTVAAEWTPINDTIVEGIYDSLSSVTEAKQAKLREALRDAVAANKWDELFAHESDSRHEDSAGPSVGGAQHTAGTGASKEDQDEANDSAAHGPTGQAPFTDLPDEECMSADVERMKALPPDPPPGANADELLAAINEAMLHLRDPTGADQQAWRLKLHRLSGALEKLPDHSARGKQTLPPTLEGTLDHLTEEEREYVKARLTEEADFFATKQYPGRIKGTEPIDIDTGDNPPVTSRYRQLSPLQQATVDEYVSKLLDAG